MLSMLCKNLKRIIKRTSKLLTLDFNKYNMVKAKNSLFFAFTMAEAVLVMTILGIIATIMITTLKPAEFKDKGLRVLAKKKIAEIDTATTQILLNDSRDGTMENLIAVDGTNFGVTSTTSSFTNKQLSAYMGGLYRKYLSASRKKCKDSNCPCYQALVSVDQNPNNYNIFYLKDGSCITIGLKREYGPTTVLAGSVFPGEEYHTQEKYTIQNSSGSIYFDTNGDEGPNEFGRDGFSIHLGKYGIMYDEE